MSHSHAPHPMRSPSLHSTTLVHSRSTAEPLTTPTTTPALVYDQRRLAGLAALAAQIRELFNVRVLYAIKACAFFDVLRTLVPSLDGFAVSSLFEARLVHGLYPDSPVHLTTPGLRDNEIDELADICSSVTFNSETHLHRFGPTVYRHADVGLRVNTQISSVKDRRYNPARHRSQLGVPLPSFAAILASSPVPVSGLHFHTNADSEDLSELATNVEVLASSIVGSDRLDWVNFGGGYLFESVADFEPLQYAVTLAKQHIAAKVFVEPGAALVRTAGSLIASVVDVFDRHGSPIAILDTSVNHLPEVLEFGYQPEIAETNPDGDYKYRIAGSTCLAGDVFGEYRFGDPLSVGARVTFAEAGAYAQAKSHRFNGLNLPSVWLNSFEGNATQRQIPDYTTYLVPVRKLANC